MATIKQISLKYVQEVYDAYFQIMKSVVLQLEDVYNIRIICKDFPDLERSLIIKKQDFLLEVNLLEVIHLILKSKELNFPLRKNKSIEIFK